MGAIPVNTGLFHYRGGSFHPDRKGEIVVGRSSLYRNPREFLGKDTYSALVLLGLEGQKGRTYEIDNVVEHVKKIRGAQTSEGPGDPGDPGASFILQRGLYRHKPPGKKARIVEEDSVRIIILHLTDTTVKEFQEEILRLAESLAEEFDQAEVIVDFQKSGVTQEVVRITTD